jgi:hypothetical protein
MIQWLGHPEWVLKKTIVEDYITKTLITDVKKWRRFYTMDE